MFFRTKKKTDIGDKPNADGRLQHIAFIMDGNGRYAKMRGMPRSYGHKVGAETFKKVVEYCGNIGIKTVTVYAFSTENWKRPKDEVDAIMSLFADYLTDAEREFASRDLRIIFLGSKDVFPESLRARMMQLEENSRGRGKTLNIAVNYGGRDEIVHAVNELIKAGKTEITEDDITAHLYTKDSPAPDMIVRTGAERRISNFLLWESAYAELYFTDVLWPDFDEREVDKCVADFASGKDATAACKEWSGQINGNRHLSRLSYRKDIRMKTRVITAAVMVAVMIPFFWFSDTILFPILMAFLAGLGVYEMQNCIGGKGAYAAWLPSAVLAVGMPFIARYLPGKALPLFFLIAFGLITLTNTVAVFSKGAYGIDTAALTSSMSVYIGFGFSAMVMLRDMACGEYIFLLTLVIPWMTDTFAYFSGRLFGKHKLIPAVSPKKTVEGSVGGTICAVLLTLLYGFLVGCFSSARPDYLGLAVLALCVSLLSQCGDLMMSLIKRKYGIKDYGRIFPGHGGVLDRFDSVICTAPFIYFLVYFIKGLSLFTR